MSTPGSSTSDSTVQRVLRDHRVVICVGAGGVGKTTVSAALALLAAQQGLRTLCLTIDPARRLASALGLASFPTQELTISKQELGARGVDVAAPLTVMMLDPRTTFDELVEEGAQRGASGSRIVQHRVYEHLVKNLAGTSAYMACEKLLRVLDEGKYDLVVLDTPPAARALDFFDAPRKMARILDSPATRALLSAFGSQPSSPAARSGRLFQAGFRAALTGMERLTGGQLLREVADLIVSMNHLLGGFGERAKRVEATLRSTDVAYLLVTSPEQRTLRDAADLASAMADRRIPVDAVVVNRVAPFSHEAASGTLGELQTIARGEVALNGSAELIVELEAAELARRRAQVLRILRMLEEAGLVVRASPPRSKPLGVALVDERAAELSHPLALLEFAQSIRLAPAGALERSPDSDSVWKPLSQR